MPQPKHDHDFEKKYAIDTMKWIQSEIRILADLEKKQLVQANLETKEKTMSVLRDVSYVMSALDSLSDEDDDESNIFTVSSWPSDLSFDEKSYSARYRQQALIGAKQPQTFAPSSSSRYSSQYSRSSSTCFTPSVYSTSRNPSLSSTRRLSIQNPPILYPLRNRPTSRTVSEMILEIIQEDKENEISQESMDGVISA